MEKMIESVGYYIRDRSKLNSNYWEDISFDGIDLDTAKLIIERDNYKDLVIENALDYLERRIGKLGNEDRELMGYVLKVHEMNKSIFVTKDEAISLLAKEVDEVRLENLAKELGYISGSAIANGMGKTLMDRGEVTKDGYAILIDSCNCPTITYQDGNDLLGDNINYHDNVAHYVVGKLDPYFRFTEVPLPKRLEEHRDLNIHVLFGSLLPVLFWKEYYSNKTRSEIVDNLVSELTSYLKADKGLYSKKGVYYKLDTPITDYELEFALWFSRSEINVSYYEELLYTRYRSDRTLEGESLTSNYGSKTVIEKLEEIAGLVRKTLYQDSFYLRDVIIRRAFRNC